MLLGLKTPHGGLHSILQVVNVYGFISDFIGDKEELFFLSGSGSTICVVKKCFKSFHSHFTVISVGQ